MNPYANDCAAHARKAPSIIDPLLARSAETVEGVRVQLEILADAEGIERTMRAALLALGDALGVCAGRLDVVTDFLEGWDDDELWEISAVGAKRGIM